MRANSSGRLEQHPSSAKRGRKKKNRYKKKLSL
jgi:hypothetical protein